MTVLSDIEIEDFKTLEAFFLQKKNSFKSFEEAAQYCISSFQSKFKESVVLARMFVTVPYVRLPDRNKKFVDKLATVNNISGLIKDDTSILSLVGTAGEEQAWFDRKNSKGHIGIPLASGDFIDSIPMMSRLLNQMGLNLNWINKGDSGLVKYSAGKITGMFYVKDAKSEVDVYGRKVITAQDFVDKYGVKTVMGFGAGYYGVTTFYTAIIFLNEELSELKARLISAGMGFFKIMTMDHIKAGNFFSVS